MKNGGGLIKRKFIRRAAGFTIVELLVTLGIFSIVAGLIYAIFIAGRGAVTKYEQLAGIAQEARGGLEQMEMELRMAGAIRGGLGVNPCNVDWPLPPATPMGKIIFIEATPTAVEFEGDVNMDGALDRIRYDYDTGTDILNRSAMTVSSRDDGLPGGVACTSSIAGRAGVQVVPVAFSINELAFRFFNSNGEELPGGPFTVLAGNHDATQHLAKIKVAVSARAIDQQGSQQFRKASMEILINNLGTTVGTEKEPPATPTGFQAIDARVCGQIIISWNPVTTHDLNGYRLYYRRSVDPEWLTVDISAQRTTWQLGGLQTDGTTIYELRLAAFDIFGNMSTTTATASVGPLNDDIDPDVPSNVTATPDDQAATITVAWTGVDRDVNGNMQDVFGQPYVVNYNLFFSAPPDVSGSVYVPGATSYIHGPVDRCVEYTYQVDAVDTCLNTSARSSAVKAKVQSLEPPPVPGEISAGGGGYIVANKTYRIYMGGTNASATAFADTKMLYNFSNQATVNCEASGPDSYNAQEPSPVAWSPSPADADSGGSFSGHWDGATKSYYCFAGYTVDGCGLKSEIKRYANAVSACKDERGDLAGSGGLGDATHTCLGSITARVCDADSVGTKECGTGGNYCKGITLFWPRTPHAQCPAYPCDVDANGYAVNCIAMATDYFPDEGIGGYILSRGTNLAAYNDLSPDPVTGPLTPFYYADSNKWETECSNQGLKDRCQFRYKIRPVDCVHNGGTEVEANPLGAYFKPGRLTIEDDASYPVKLIGKNLNIVEFTIKNTAAADMLLTRGNFDWNGENWGVPPGSKAGYISRIDINTSGTWATIWQASVPDPKKPENSLIDVTDTNILASGAIGVSDEITRVKLRVYFVDSSSRPLTLTSSNLTVNPELYLILYYKNKSGTKDIGSLESECKPENTFTVKVPGSPRIANTYQTAPSAHSVTSATAPPSGFRADQFLIESTSNVTVSASIQPYQAQTGYVPVAECGAKLYYYVADPTVTAAPTPIDGTGAENVNAPTNYTGVNMCNTALTSCSTSSCTYRTTVPVQPGNRVFFYIIATDDKGNFGIGPYQPPEATSFVGYTYDTKNRYYYLWLTPYYDSSQFMVDGITPNPNWNRIAISQLWLTAVSGCSSGSAVDTRSAGSSASFTLTQYDAGGAVSFMESLGPLTSASGCPGCWPCESGTGATSFSTNQFDPAYRITISSTATKSDFTTKTCTWSNGGSGTTFSSGGDTTCK